MTGLLSGLSDSRWATESSSNHRNARSRSSRRRPDSDRSLSPLSRTASDSNLNRLSQLEQHPRLHRDRSLPIRAPLLSSRSPSPQFLQDELSRFMKITSRLNWKLPFLNEGYNKATATFGKSKSDIEACEIQFKLDFHEFYMLLERALLRLMGIFQITVNGTDWFRVPETGLAASRHSGRQHRFHANVLAALEDGRNPLSSIFRDPKVREQLARAKDLRNRWKNIDEAQPETVASPPLRSYNLNQIVTTILSAIEQAHVVAVEYIRENGGDPDNDATRNSAENWDFMVDAMDWERV